MSADRKKRAREAIKDGRAGFIIGTQALIQEKVDMHNLALIIIDEQHRFGVEQRKTLMAKAGHMPHVLSLTATPIPRSLALTLYGELDISLLKEKPAGRQAVITEIVSPNARDRLYARLDKELAEGRQMFVVCPLITESAGLDAQSAEKTYERLKGKDFKHRRVGLLHGQLKAADKQAVMKQFVEGKLDILVSTTVIEVGVDVPNASIMLIESAERFGLAQLHQLRGRVGRGGDQGYCYLLTSDSSAPSKRLRALESSQDGFKLAEMDLELRGPGAIYGTSQHGQLDLRIAKLSDMRLIASARQAAERFIDSGQDLLQYEELSKTVTRLRAVTNLN
jgi:ATP-dependent DNA helicase RecG